jgi:hypothetical protein
MTAAMDEHVQNLQSRSLVVRLAAQQPARLNSAPFPIRPLRTHGVDDHQSVPAVTRASSRSYLTLN